MINLVNIVVLGCISMCQGTLHLNFVKTHTLHPTGLLALQSPAFRLEAIGERGKAARSTTPPFLGRQKVPQIASRERPTAEASYLP